MRISGLQKLTLLDYPGRIACTVFLPGCNLRCPFCHNASLVLPERLNGADLPEESFFSFLQSRVRKLDGVCVTGGEPTLHAGLPDFLRHIRNMGFAVKLDTNGTNPAMLHALLQDGLVDYVAMDIKNSPERYRETCGGMDVLQSVRESAALLMNCGCEYEFRTTVVDGLHTEADLRQIGLWLRGAKRYYLQQFVDSGDLVAGPFRAFDPQQMETLRQAVLPYIPNTALRGL